MGPLRPRPGLASPRALVRADDQQLGLVGEGGIIAVEQTLDREHDQAGALVMRPLGDPVEPLQRGLSELRVR